MAHRPSLPAIAGQKRVDFAESRRCFVIDQIGTPGCRAPSISGPLSKRDTVSLSLLVVVEGGSLCGFSPMPDRFITRPVGTVTSRTVAETESMSYSSVARPLVGSDPVRKHSAKPRRSGIGATAGSRTQRFVLRIGCGRAGAWTALHKEDPPWHKHTKKQDREEPAGGGSLPLWCLPCSLWARSVPASRTA
jgi:hypothetical protein